MPRIRKKTSNRKSTNDLAKLRHKVSEGKKKKRKLAKKNPQWKSRLPKDPGIPNNLPFKDQILAEIADERRRADEEKQARKASKNPSKSFEQHHEKEDGSYSGDEAAETGVGEGSVGLSALLTAKTLRLTKKPSKYATPVATGAEGTPEEPLLIDPSIPDLRSALDQSDVWLYVLDARDPQAHRSRFIESLATEKHKRLVFLLNKIDLVPKESVVAWLAHLRQFHPTFPFRVASSHIPPDDNAKGKAIPSEDDAIGSMALVSHLITALPDKPDVTVALVGLPTVGKSSVVNSICGASRLPTYKPDATKGATTTVYPQPVSYVPTLPSGTSGTIRFIDAPGLECVCDGTASEESSAAISDVLLRARGRIEKMRRPELAAHQIILRANPEDLMLHYNTPAYNTSEPDAFLSGHARVTGRLKKGGVLDLVDSARSLLRDWRVGKFPFYTMPPKHSTAPAPLATYPGDISTVDYDAVDNVVAPFLRSRKDLRIAGGVIRLSPGSIDERTLQLYGPALPGTAVPSQSHAPDPSVSGGSDEGDEDGGMDWCSGEDEESEGEVEEASFQPPERKRKHEASISVPKRKRTTLDLTPSRAQSSASARKVSFASGAKRGKGNNADLKSRPTSEPKRTGVTSTSKTAALKAKLPKPAKEDTARVGAKLDPKAGPKKRTDGIDAYDFKQFF